MKNLRTGAVAVSVAMALLLLGLLIFGTIEAVDDFRTRSDERATIRAASADGLQNQLEAVAAPIRRQVNEVELTAQIVASDLVEDPSITSLAKSISTQSIAERLPLLRAIGLQDPLAQVEFLDRFGNPLDDADIERFALDRFDPGIALAVTSGEPFVRMPVEVGSPMVFHPIGDRGNWLVLVLDAAGLTPGAEFVAVGDASEQSSFTANPPIADLTVAERLFDTAIVATTQIDTGAGSPPSWFPFILRLLGLLGAVGAAVILGRMFHRLNKRVGEVHGRLQSGSSIGMEQNIIGVVQLDETGIIVDANQAYCEQVRLDRDSVVGVSLLSLTEPADRPRHLAALDKMMSGGVRSTKVEHRVTTDDEADVWVLEHLSRDLDAEGDETRIVVQSQDITFRRYATWELAKQALHDDLTGLANRQMLVHRLRAALEVGPGTTDDEAPSIGVMFIDVDRFKMVNDSLGHDVGDRLIQHVGTRMKSAVRPDDVVSRFGGDEFVIMCEASTLPEVLAVAERIRSSVADPFVDNGNRIHQTLSIGIAVCAPGEMTVDELLGNADSAMYRAKQRGRNRVEVFDEGMRHLLDQQVQLQSELRAAIDAEAISMYFQPIVDSTTYATAGFESLIRWHHPERGLMTPGQFLPVAEGAGLTEALDAVALKITCDQMAKWAARFPLANNLYVSVNKVPKNFPKFVEQIRQVVHRSGLPASLLVVEVVENALIDNGDGAIEAIEALKEMGVRVAIDDFGTGYSSLSYLTQFRPTTLKIDRAFVQLLPDDDATASVVRAITDMASALDINVIAEGVETWEQAEMLQRVGVPYFQGYLFAKPRPAEEIEAWFVANGDETARGISLTAGSQT